MTANRALWLEIIAGPSVWFVSLLASFALSPLPCGSRENLSLLAISSLALIIAAGAALLSWRQIARSGMLAYAGVSLNVLFVLVIFGQLIVSAVLGCE